jgi:hypothetical protein
LLHATGQPTFKPGDQCIQPTDPPANQPTNKQANKQTNNQTSKQTNKPPPLPPEKAAHIGVGISGREGRAAAQAADFSFGQFRFLPRLLLVHGRQSYLRCREVVLYAFYKNAAYVSCFIYYAAHSGGAWY